MNAIDAMPRARRAVRQTFGISVAALLAYIGIRSLPVDSGGLHYDDFRAGQAGALELCEPGGPQFVSVDRVRSPVTMTVQVASVAALEPGVPAQLLITLTAASGKPVTEDDLLVVHTQKLHVLVIDPSLDDYQHLHPQAAATPGTFTVSFTPRRAGEYRVFADFTPRATGRALYAGARLHVGSAEPESSDKAAATHETRESVVAGYRFTLSVDREPARINETAELRLEVRAPDGSPAQLEEIMGASAHVVAFDRGRTGFAHLHPIAAPSGERSDSAAPLRFQLNLLDPGTYRLWAQVKIAGKEVFAPFGLTVQP